MNYQRKLEADCINTLSEKDHPKSKLGDVTQTFEDIIALLHKICGPSGELPGIFCERDTCCAYL